jgi:hypothetical protein
MSEPSDHALRSEQKQFRRVPVKPEEREEIERRIAEINEQLRISSPQEISGSTKVPEIEANEIEELYEERDHLLKKLDLDAD